MDSASQKSNQHVKSTHQFNSGQVVNRTQGTRGNPVSSPFRLRGGSKPFREMDRSDMEKFEMKQVDLVKPKVVALPAKSSIPPHLLMTALLEQLCHLYVPQDKDLANKVFKMLCENLSKLNVISPLSHLDEMRHLRKQHGITFRRLMGAALQTIKQSQIVRALPGIGLVPNPIPNKGERILLQEELMDEFSSRYEEEFEELGHLGSGGFGSVFKVKNNLDKRCYAIKKIRFKQKNHELLHKLLREVRVLAHLQHTNIVGYNGAWIESHNPFSSSKGTSSENTASQGYTATDSPRDMKVNNESQSVEFLSESDGDTNGQDGSSYHLKSPRIPLQFGARYFSQVKDSALLTTRVQTKNVISSTTSTTAHRVKNTFSVVKDDEFSLFNSGFMSHGPITEITELSSSEYSSSSFASSIEETNRRRDSILKQTKTELKLKTSSTCVMELVGDFDNNDENSEEDGNDIINDDSDDDCDNNPNFDVAKQTVKHCTEINNSTSAHVKNSNLRQNSFETDEESHVLSTGFSISDANSRQMSVTSDVSSDIPNSSNNFVAQTADTTPGDYLPSYFEDVVSIDNSTQPKSDPQTNDLPLFQKQTLMDSWNGDVDGNSLKYDAKSVQDQTRATSAVLPSDENISPRPRQKPFSDIPQFGAGERSMDVNSNNGSFSATENTEAVKKNLSLIPFQGKFYHLPQRCCSYSGVEGKAHSHDEEMEVCEGRYCLEAPQYVRSLSNVEGDRFRGAGESKDHSYDFQNSIVLYIQMELCFQTLCDWLVERNDNINLSTAYHDRLCSNNMVIFRQLLEGVDFIHSNGLIHRDLKPRNIFLSGKNLHVKIGDFGLAKEEVLHDGKECSILYSDWMTSGHIMKKQHTTGVGTTGYAAPEQIHGSVYNAKSDMYSLGVVLFEIFNTFKTDMERTQNILNPKQSSCLTEIQTRWPKQAEAICRLTDENPEQRPLAGDLLKGELFLSPEQEIKHLKQTIAEKDKTIESLRQEIRALKAEKENLFGAFSL